MSDTEHCIVCGCGLTHNEIGLHKKLVNRGAKEYMCMKCLAEHFGLTVGECERMIEGFRSQGCTLFV